MTTQVAIFETTENFTGKRIWKVTGEMPFPTFRRINQTFATDNEAAAWAAEQGFDALWVR